MRQALARIASSPSACSLTPYYQARREEKGRKGREGGSKKAMGYVFEGIFSIFAQF
jgi:hypothetical protein